MTQNTIPAGKIRKLAAFPIHSTVTERRELMVADRVIAWDARQTAKIREAARARSLRLDDQMAEEGQPSVLTDADEAAKALLREAGLELALAAGQI